MSTIEFNKQVLNFKSALSYFALSLTSNSEDAKDLLQDTLVKALVYKDKFTDATNLKAWLYTIMKNTFITQYHRMVRRNTFIDSTDNLHFINSSDSLIENGASGTFAMDDINEALDHLKSEYRDPFLMHFRGYKYHEIAERLDIPIGTVKNRIHWDVQTDDVQLLVDAGATVIGHQPRWTVMADPEGNEFCLEA